MPSSSRTEIRSTTLTATAPLCVVPDFLEPGQAQEALTLALNDIKGFQTATTLDGTPNARRAQVRYTLLPHTLGAALAAVLPTVERALGVTSVTKQVECQITLHRDGDYFQRHLDVGGDNTASRRISFVYYLHRNPRPFSGGQLRVYDSLITQERTLPAASFRDIKPVHNSIVFFPSAGIFHEVLPISCSSARPEDGRITWNGWIH